VPDSFPQSPANRTIITNPANSWYYFLFLDIGICCLLGWPDPLVCHLILDVSSCRKSSLILPSSKTPTNNSNKIPELFVPELFCASLSEQLNSRAF
jgi:hypothetical protein